MGRCCGLEMVRDLDQKRLTTEAAAGLERRQVFRLLKA
jgi:hypothetical protein